MSKPLFALQLVYPDGTPLTFEAGSRFERDFVQSIVDAIMAKGVGFFKTEAHVRADIEAGIKEAIWDLKAETVRDN
jgi:hypothetical protein